MRIWAHIVGAGWLWALAIVVAPAGGHAQIGSPQTVQDTRQDTKQDAVQNEGQGTASAPSGPGRVATPAGIEADTRPLTTPAAPAPRGLFGDLGKLFEPPSLSWTPPAIKSPSEVIEDFNARARDAGEDLSRLGRGPVVLGRARCPVAANGAPDCQAAADRLCRDKGFSDGRTIDVEAAQVCSPRALLSGRTDEPGACRMENYVTRAMCQ